MKRCRYCGLSIPDHKCPVCDRQRKPGEIPYLICLPLAVVLLVVFFMTGCKSSSSDGPNYRQIAMSKTGSYQYALIGDSITYRWKECPLADSVNLGVPGDTIAGVQSRIRDGQLSNITADTIILNIGTNDYPALTPEEIVQGINDLRDELEQYADVIVMVPFKSPMKAPMPEIVGLLLDDAHYIETEGLHLADNLHFQQEVYCVWRDYIESL